ncbi:hypothetical protein QJS10_CPB21g00071 [Acorus calamus]|uniref:Uncharacterized protein n=1 Tax=Acorus calamus TaxID=4465 RepID=A0AAV9C689_ACOCL|nr:hypothetical protein QJS10_CPB21g00071 [Acorus calamus]
MLDSGDPDTQQWMKATESSYKDKFRGWDTIANFDPYASKGSGKETSMETPIGGALPVSDTAMHPTRRSRYKLVL